MFKKRSFLTAALAVALVAFAGAAFGMPLHDPVHGLLTLHAAAVGHLTVHAMNAAGLVAIRPLKAKKAEVIKAAEALIAGASAGGRDLTAEEQTAFEGHKASIESLNAQIERAEFLANQHAGLDANRGVVVQATSRVTVSDNRADDPRHGFRSFGEFAAAVRAGSTANGPRDERLLIGAAAPSTFGSEGNGQDGGFLVPPEFSREIFNLSIAEDSLLPMVDGVTTSSNSMVFPKDETTPWGTDGVRAYWQAEATAATATKPKLGTSIMRLHKLMALVPLTEELVADTSALDAYLPNLVGRSIRWKTNEALLRGDGAGQPLGMFSGGAAVTVAKDSGQAANTVTIGNVTNMIARLPPGSFPRAQWLITPDALPSLFQLQLGNYPIYLPISAGAQGSPYGTLMGRPIMVSQHAAAFSSAGDLMLVDGQFYRALTRGAGIETASSMHLYFDAAAVAFRAMFRIDGQPKIAASIPQAKGGNALSPFVQLGAR